MRNSEFYVARADVSVNDFICRRRFICFYKSVQRFSIADSNVTYRSLLKAFAQANIRNPILPIRRLRFNGQPYKNKSKPRADRTTSKSRVWCVITIKYEKGNLRKKIINFYLNIMRRQITTYEKNFSSSLIFNWLLYFFEYNIIRSLLGMYFFDSGLA